MYVRYLQHQHHGTVQLLTMPLSTAAGSFRSSNRSNLQDDEENVECEPVPLPIQTFFWRQTNPFIGGKIGKLHEASCVTFERVVVQNIMHGLSPSLSDAIQSISRWRFVRAAFPHVIQCCTALLGERSREDESLPMSGSLAKTLYILHWLLMDSATECNDMSLEEASEGALCIRNLAFSISSIELFCYQLIPLIHLIKEDEIESNIRLESGLRIWQALWQCRPPDVLCFSAPVKQRRNPLPQVAIAKKPQPLTAVEQGIYLGEDTGASTSRRMSQMPTPTLIPPPKPPRTDPKVVQELAKSAQSSPQPGKVEKDPMSSESKESKSDSQPTCSIVRSISDYKTSELASSAQQKIQQMKKSRTDTFHSSPDSDAYAGMKAIDEATKFIEENNFSDIFTDKAPLVQLNDICSGGSIDASDHQSTFSYSHSAAESVSLASQQTVINRTREVAAQETFQQLCIPPPAPPVQLPQPQPPPPPQPAPVVLLESTKDPGSVSALSEKGDTPLSDPHEACYVDIAVIKCLLIKNWSEEGVFWAVRYLLNRLTDIRHYRSMYEGRMRNRSNSVPSIAPRESKHSLLEADYLTWADLQDRTEAINKRIINMERKYSRDVILDDEHIKLKVAFSVEQQKSEDNRFLKASPKDQRRISLNTLPVQQMKKLSQDRPRRVRIRSKSDPSINQNFDNFGQNRKPSDTISTIEVPASDKRRQSSTAQNFFPEAIGSGPFIEKNGHLSFNVILQSLVNLCNNEKCNVVRVSEIILNICDTLLMMPNLDNHVFFEGIIKIILRTYVHLGCPSGCNEGMRTPQADFLRIKAKSLLSLMHKMNAPLLTDILKTHVAESTVQQLIDCLHSITVFCQAEVGPNRIRINSARRRSSATDTRSPNYKNNFNESLTGMEGYIINTMLTPMSSKLMSKLNELFLPENMSLYQDVRMFVAYLQENHGNPIRRSALSILSARFNLDLEKKVADAAETKSIETIELESRKDSNLTVPTQRDNASMRRGLFKKKEKTIVVDDISEGDSSPSTPRHAHIPSIDESSLSAAGSPLLVQQAKKKSGGKLQFAFNLLKSAKHEVAEDENWEELDDSAEENSSRPLDSDSRSRISFKNVAQKVNYFRQRNSLSVDNSISEIPEKSSESNIAQLYLPPRKMVAIKDIREGARRFAFFLETCKPGQMPDPPLIAALMELKSPVLGRAVLLLECAHFIHRCNRNDWPEWVRSNFAQNRAMSGVTTTTGGGITRSVQGGSRKVFLMQRAAGRSFYDWAVQIAARLQKFLEKEEIKPKTEEDKRRLKLFDDIEDFLDDSTVNDGAGEHCPPALQLMACLVLYQITAFLRETFQLIPRSKPSQRTQGSTSGWEKLMSHRRWSILSNTFNPQSGSIHSINEVHPTIQSERRVSYSTADEESSPRGSNDMIEEQLVTTAPDKKESALTAFRRFAYRTRQASRDPSVSTPEDVNFISTERDSARSRILRSQMCTPVPPPRAASPTPAHVSESVRRLAQGRQRLLKRGSPSIGQTQPSLEQSGRRRDTSFKLRKQSKPASHGQSEKDSDDQEGAPIMLDAGSNRKSASTKSAGSRWKMRSMRVRSPGAYSQSSMHSVHTVEEEAPRARDSLKPLGPKSSMAHREEPQPAQIPGEPQSSPERRSHMGSYSSSQGAPPLPQMMTSHTIEDEEEEMLKNMPWLNAMIMFSKQFDMSCTHDRFCTKWCFDRVHRQCYRLTEAFNQVYDETIPENSKIDKRKQLIESWQKKQEFNMQKRHSKPRRESAAVRQSGVERVPLALRGLLIEKLNEIEESKSSKKDGAQIPEEPVDSSELDIKRSPMLNYIRTQLLNIIHTPISTMLKSAIIMTVDHYKSILNVSWNLLLNNDPHVVSTAASMFICCSVRCSDDSINLIKLNLSHPDATYRTEAIRRFLALWRNRFHVWLKMEEGAQLIFKVPPPSIDFTLPSPPIGQNQLVVVDPPWMPHVKTKVEELSLKEEEHSTSQTIMTMTRTRRKQKQEMVKKAIREAEERQSELRQQFPLRATAIVQQAAYEPALFHHQLNVQQQEKNAEGEEADVVHATHSRQQQMPVAQPLFPSSILSIVPLIIEMLDDVQVDKYGISVGEVCKKVVWSCIVEDTSLFLRHFLEKLTNKDKQEYLLSLLRKLILTFRPLPSQTAFSLLNYLFGFVMFYVRSPSEGSDKSLALALSVAWLVVPYVHGLYFKDMKQTLKKEQCDQALMITANVPSAKKIIVHGPDSASGGIPSQFPIHEDTQFQQIFTDSLEFFNISENEIGQYFLVDAKTGMVHSSSNYVRDFYFFHRSFYPQLSLVKMNPDSANYKMREMAFHQKMIETGKVLLTYNALKFSPESVIPQRIFFLHDEFTHLPSFPRRSLESSFGMCEGPMGEELKAIDEMHKFVWAKLMSDMFEKMENAFMFGDLHLFINVINGIMILHCEDVLILRRCMATYITMAIHFQTLFASQGFFLIIPTIIRCYSQRQPNRMFVQVVEFVCKQFYILHRKPFLLQMFGAIADMCDQNNNDLEINAMQVKAKYLFNLLRAMENLNEIPDQLDILSLVPPHLKPLKALDLCYRDDPNTFIILTDALASCVTVCAFSPESRRCHQMMLIMQCILPHLIKTMEAETTKQNNAPVAIKHELHAYSTLCVEMKALINSCETLSRAPTRTFDIVTTVSDRGKSFIADSPQFFDPPTTGEDEGKHGNTGNAVNKERKITNNQGGWEANDNAELQKDMFRGPRDALLVLCSMFIEEAGPRLKELGKLASPLEHIKIPELLDHRCHVKLSEIALSLLKIAPYDLTTMGCNGLQKYFMTILPVADWSVETNRSALSVILRRLDKTIAKIGKKSSIRRRANWNSITNWLTGLYNTLTVFPYIAHLHPVKAITQMCLRITVGDQCGDEGGGSGTISHTNPATILNSSIPPQSFCTAVLKLTSFLMQALGQFAFSLEFVCSPEGLGSAAERLEAVLCHILIPLFLRAAMPGKDAPQFQPKDLIYCLNVIHNAISPPLAKQSLAPASSANLASSLIRGTTIHDTTGRQGSVSVAERGHSATVSTHRIIRDSVIQCVFLALKVMILAFTKQLTPYWVKVTKIVKDILAKKVGGQALYTFIEFLNSVNLPISVMLVPIVHNKLTQKVEQESTWQTEFRDKMIKPKMGSSTESIKEVPRSHTPTLGDMHSDSGSVQSVGTHRSSHGRQTVSESRRLSSSTFSKFRSGGGTKPTNITSTAPSESHNIQDTTIMEDTEDETTQMIAGKVQKSPSLPTNRMAQAQSRRSIGGLGMWRSMRKRSSKYFGDDASKNLEMRDMMRRTKSWNKRIASHHGFGDDPVVITPLTMPETQVTSEMSIAAAPTTSSIKTSEKPESSAASVSSSGDRPRIVSFSTPKKEHVRKKSETISEDSEEYCITSTRHLI